MSTEQEMDTLGKKVETQAKLIEKLQGDNFDLLLNQTNLKELIDWLNKENNKLSKEINSLNQINTSLNYTYNKMVYEALDKLKN